MVYRQRASNLGPTVEPAADLAYKQYDPVDYAQLLIATGRLEQKFNALTMISPIWLGIQSNARQRGGSGLGLFDNLDGLEEDGLAEDAEAADQGDKSVALCYA